MNVSPLSDIQRRAKAALYAKLWRLANPEKSRAIIKKWQKNNRAHINAKRRERTKLNPRQTRVASQKHYAKHRDMILARNKLYRLKNLEKALAGQRGYYQANKKKACADAKAWRLNNPERYRASKRKWETANKEKVRQYKRNWNKKNPENLLINKHLRRAREHACEGKLSKGIVARLREIQSNRCPACQSDLSNTGCHVDHVVALSRGGLNRDDNIQLLCPSCNYLKHTKDNSVFMREIQKSLFCV